MNIEFVEVPHVHQEICERWSNTPWIEYERVGPPVISGIARLSDLVEPGNVVLCDCRVDDVVVSQNFYVESTDDNGQSVVRSFGPAEERKAKIGDVQHTVDSWEISLMDEGVLPASCPVCKGTGKTPLFTSADDCDACGGKGTV